MVEASQTRVHRYNTAIANACNRIAEIRNKKIAVAVAARKLLMCCFSVLKTKQPYYHPDLDVLLALVLSLWCGR